MTKLVALSLLMLPLAFGGSAYAGKFGNSSFNPNHPTSVQGSSSQCMGPHHNYFGDRCAPHGNPGAPSNPQGGCGYYGPNGVLIECK